MEGVDGDREPYEGTKASKFRLKSKSSRSKRHRTEETEHNPHDGRSRKRHRASDGHRDELHRSSKRTSKHSSKRTVYETTFPRHGGYDETEHRYRESLYDGLQADQPESPHASGLDPDAAFRESLFDALADDEGAEYWESVYGQPVHIYPNAKPGPDGKLERMTDEEYAEYVRTKMWEKSHQHILEEREAKERARQKAKEKKRQMDEDFAREEEEREDLRRRMQESLRRGEERKKTKEVEPAWTQYLQEWEELKQRKDLAQESAAAKDLIPWPVVSGKRRHVSKDEIEYFFENSPAWREDPTAMLKIERVRWHPDKMQQRFGQHIDSDTMRSITAVFQVVDRLWTEKSRLR